MKARTAGAAVEDAVATPRGAGRDPRDAHAPGAARDPQAARGPADTAARPTTGRRATLCLPGALLGLSLTGRPTRAAPAATLLVPGPDGGALARWSERLLQRFGTPALDTRMSIVGGPDGVTAANRFSTLTAGDGQLLLVLPGGVPMASLSGSERVSYNPHGWLPLCLSWRPALIAGRGPLRTGPGGASGSAAGGTTPRLGLPGPDSPEGGAVLALESLGCPVSPVPFGAGGAEAAFATGAVDAVLLTGRNALATAAQLGATPWCGFGIADPAVPDFASLAVVPGPVRDAVRAVVGTAQLHAALVMPALTPANTVATWRQAATRWREAEQQERPDAAAEPFVGAEAVAALTLLTPPAPAVLHWRDWLSRRLNWRPG